MEITATKLTGSSVGAQSSITTPSLNFRSSKLYFVVVAQHDSSPNQPTISGGGLTWEVEKTQVNATDSSRRISIFRGMGSGITGALTIDFGGEAQTGAYYCVVEINYVTGGSNGNNATVQNTSTSSLESSGNNTLTLSAFSGVKNGVIAVCMGPADNLATPSGMTLVHEETQTYSGILIYFKVAFKSSPQTSIVFTWSSGGSSVATGIAVELKYLPPSGNVMFMPSGGGLGLG